MKNFFIVFLISLFFSCSSNQNGKVVKVEHLYISCPDAASVFDKLKRQFGLPIVWAYQDWGDFKSGGLSLGNVVLEIKDSSSDSIPEYYGLALEPNCSLDRFVSFLDSSKIAYNSIKRSNNWSTLDLNRISQAPLNVFLCDYHDREFVRKDRKEAADELNAHSNNRLGILLVKAIIIHTPQPNTFSNDFVRIPGLIEKGNRFHFETGPDLSIQKSDSFSIELQVKVSSIDQTRGALNGLGYATQTNEQRQTIPADTFHVRMSFIE